MTVKDLVEKYNTWGFSLLYNNLQTEEGLVKVHDRIDTDDTINPFLSKQVKSFKIGTCYPSYFTLSII